MGLSKLHDKCKKCKYKDHCNDKRMAACAVAELPPTPLKDARAQMTARASMPMAKKHTPITINMGEYGTIDTSLEELQKQLKENFYNQISCGFNRTL